MWTVFSAVVEVMAITSGHLEQARITCNQLHLSFERTSKIYVKLFPGLLWYFPWMKWSLDRISLILLTGLAPFNTFLWLSIRGHQSCIRASDFIQTMHSCMFTTVHILWHLLSQRLGNDHSQTTQNATLMYG